MGRATRAGDDDADAASSSVARVFCGTIGRTVCRGYVNLVGNPETLERFASLAHNLKVGVAAHHDRNQGFAQFSPFKAASSCGSRMTRVICLTCVPRCPCGSARRQIEFYQPHGKRELPLLAKFLHAP